MAFIYDLADTWNDAGTTFTAIKMDVTDTASASDSKLLDLQIGGVSIFSVGTGAVTRGLIKLSDRSTISTTNGPWFNTGTAEIAGFGGYLSGILGLALNKSSGLNWTNANSINSQVVDLILARDAAGTLAQKGGTNAQTFNLYNTYTDASNYERASFTQTATGLVLDSQYLGTGTEPDNILELKSGGASQLSVAKSGLISTVTSNVTGLLENLWIKDTYNIAIGSYAGTWITFNTSASANGTGGAGFSASELRFSSAHSISWTPGGAFQSNPDLKITRDAADTLAQRNSTNAQTFNLYNTYTDASNYERGFMKWNSNVLEIGTEKAGTGTDRFVRIKSSLTNGILFAVSGNDKAQLSTNSFFPSTDNGITLGQASRGWGNTYISGSIIVFSSLPTADPVNAGQLWNDSGTLKVSAG